MRHLKIFLLLVFFAGNTQAQSDSASPEQPSLVLVVMVDQMRYDYLTRYGAEFDGGLGRLLREGAVFTNANYESSPTFTAIGHSTVLTGATPSLSGIAGNSWYSRAEGRNVESITDTQVVPLGTEDGASPRRLRVSTLGDELKLSGKGGKVYGVSLKDRSAILPAGHMADGAFWLENGQFVSSNWYFPALPEWTLAFNAENRADAYAGQEWMGRILPSPAGPQLYRALDATPFADELVLDFALHLLASEQLGTSDKTDLLSVSFSAMDYLGHGSGPDTEQMHAMVLSIDDKVARLLNAAEAQAGARRVLLVMTSDHGVAPVPEENIARQLPGGRYDGRAQSAAVEAALNTAFGEGDYILAAGSSYYLNYAALPDPAVSRKMMEDVVAEALRRQLHVARVYTRTALENGQVGGDRIDQRVVNGFHREESGDVIVIHDPYWLGLGSGTTHGSPYSYDTHVPLIFWGAESLIVPGRYHQAAAIHDIAPTLATILGVAAPSGTTGRVLHEILP